ncbi:peptidase dimerization domain-containing protein, partial [Streptococcus pneumoniae]
AKLSQNQPHFALSEIRGGSIRNAIPREAVAVLAFNGDVKAIESAVENLAVVLKEELAIAEPNLTLFVEFVEKSATVFTAQS